MLERMLGVGRRTSAGVFPPIVRPGTTATLPLESMPTLAFLSAHPDQRFSQNWKKRIAQMTRQVSGPLLSLASSALIMGASLASCSKPAEQNTAAPAVEQNASGEVATEQAAPANDASAQNAKKLLKAMSDYLAAQ